MTGHKNLFQAVNGEVVCLRIGAVGQNWKVFNCVPEENSLDIQKVVIAQSLHCTFKKQSMFGFIFPLVQEQPIRQGVCFQSLFTAEGTELPFVTSPSMQAVDSGAQPRLLSSQIQCFFSSNTWHLRKARKKIQSFQVILCLYYCSR